MDDVARDELASFCLHALTAGSDLPSKAAIHWLTTVTVVGLCPPGPPAVAAGQWLRASLADCSHRRLLRCRPGRTKDVLRSTDPAVRLCVHRMDSVPG